MSQTKLAKIVGVSVSAVHYWEVDDKKKRTSPTQANLIEVAKAFGVTLERFYGSPPKPAKKAS